MNGDHRIGRIVAVDTGNVTVELADDLKALTRSTYEGTIEVGQINSYVIVPVGARRIVAMVTRVLLTEEGEVRTDRTMVVLPKARRIMRASLIGTLEDEAFSQGVNSFPAIDSPVLLPTKDELRTIFGARPGELNPQDPNRPGYCVAVGRSSIFPEFDILINPDVFFGKHAAVIGSTGSGKSCTIAAILQSILQRPEIRQTRFIVLDTNGEYRAAFQNLQDGAATDTHQNYRCLYIPTDARQPTERLAIPYWFMNSEDFSRLFRAQPGIQRPVLLHALRLARAPGVPGGEVILRRDFIVSELQSIVALGTGPGRVSVEVRDAARGLRDVVQNNQPFQQALSAALSPQIVDAMTTISNAASAHVNNEYSRPLPPNVKLQIETLLAPLIAGVMALGTNDPDAPYISADTPVYFRKTKFMRQDIADAMRRDEAGAARTREHCATMLMRIYRLLEDRRFEFLFGEINSELPAPLHGLATFVRDLVGLPVGAEQLSTPGDVPAGVLPYYDRQRQGGAHQGHNVVIVDLSLLASEVLENVTALIGRILLEFLQRAGDTDVSGIDRGEFPIVLVLEEAQNYLRETRSGEDESISRQVFERIAREGRKFGLGLVIASQRPSELSKAVLSQCSTFVVHRLQNPEDLRYFREIVPGVFNEMLGQLPALAPRNALVLGEAVRAPALAYMREARPVPRSQNPGFYRHWVSAEPAVPDVEAVCERWEGQDDGGD